MAVVRDKDVIRAGASGLDRRKAPLLKWVEPRVRELYRRGSRVIPELIGSCTLVRVEKDLFLATAAHVWTEQDGGILLVATDEDLVRLDLDRLPWRRDDALDLLVVKLPTQAQAWSVSWFEWKHVALTVPRDRLPYFLFGFPWREGSVDVREARLGAKGVGYSGLEADAATYGRHGFDSATHLLVDFNRKQAVQDGQIRAMKKPHGMSGGAAILAGTYLTPPLNPPAGRLFGVLTQYREGKKGVMISVRMHVMQGIMASLA